MNIVFDKIAWGVMVRSSEEAYPKETCGLLFAREGSNLIAKVEILNNILEKKHEKRLEKLLQAGAVNLPQDRLSRGGAFEFLIDPEEHYAKLMEAQKMGYDQIGLFHSHPDHPAEPSPTDAAQPMLVGWANIIAAVHKGKFVEARSFVRETENSPFQEQKILVE